MHIWVWQVGISWKGPKGGGHRTRQKGRKARDPCRHRRLPRDPSPSSPTGEPLGVISRVLCAQTVSYGCEILQWTLRGWEGVRGSRAWSAGQLCLGAGRKEAPEANTEVPKQETLPRKSVAPHHHNQNKCQGVPLVAQRVRTQHNVHEDSGLIPGLNRWVKDPVLPQAVVQGTDAAQIWRWLLWVWCRPAAAAPI